MWVSAVSGLVESPALKPEGADLDAPSYLNAVATVRTRLTAHGLLRTLNRIESELGRVRRERCGDRSIDLDIISFGDVELSDDVLTLPHPRAAERAFVLVPWMELDSEAVLPGRGPVAALVSATIDDVWPWTGEP